MFEKIISLLDDKKYCLCYTVHEIFVKSLFIFSAMNLENVLRSNVRWSSKIRLDYEYGPMFIYWSGRIRLTLCTLRKVADFIYLTKTSALRFITKRSTFRFYSRLCSHMFDINHDNKRDSQFATNNKIF